MYPKAKEDFEVDAVMDMVELSAYSFNRSKFTPEEMKLMGYPNVEVLEVRYREVVK